jgi:chromosome condensin MukBEF ATPase and DNA-binding subunit MukB
MVKITELEKARQKNANIEKSKQYKANYDDKLRGIQADKDIAISAAKDAIASERSGLQSTIASLTAQIKAAEDKIIGLDNKLNDKISVANGEYTAAKAELDSNIGVASQYADKPMIDTSDLQAEINTAQAMKKHLNEFSRMKATQKEVKELQIKSDELTEKIDIARRLPGVVLSKATIPVEGLTVENGIPLVHGLPLSNLSDGEKLDLCVDVAISNPKGLQIILIDGAERLDDKSRAALYEKCAKKGLQFIATRTDNSDELVITEMELN